MTQANHPPTDRIDDRLAAATADLDLASDREALARAAERDSYDGADADEIDEALIGVLTARTERDPAHDDAAARIARWRHARNVTGTDGPLSDETYRASFVEAIETGVERDLLDERMAAYDLEALAEAIVPERDDEFGYIAVSTLVQRYFLRTVDGDESLELPQAFWMRVAMGVALAEPPEDREERAIEFYEALSTLRFVHSTPTLFHAGTTHPQLSSCYLTTVQDDLEDIFDSFKAHAKLSKWSGGLGNDWTNVRAEGSLIESTGVESTGVVPFLNISDDVTGAINRSGKRRGAACAYLAAWHLDFPAFLDLKRNTGDERRRTHDMNTAAWVPDLFVKRVRADEQWTLFSPDEAPELHEATGQEFEELYEEYERAADDGELRQYERVEAAELWRTMLTRLFETGHPWITFKDPCNVRSPQDHYGTINSSNLCTEITLNTSQEETAVCNLGSINLAEHVDDGELDGAALEDTVETAMRMLDNVVDLNFYPTDRAERANTRHRPVGLGVMGFHEMLTKRGVGMASDEALDAADRTMERVAYHAILNSSRLAKERGT
ncbi:MAG: ribonucleoside-diphosphate reductase subunit alpha, partial [Halolamina sp.]